MFKKRDIELIILDVLGCLDEQDRESLRFLKENDETFCRKELGEAQNLSALFASIEKFDIPSIEAKEIVVRKLNRMIFGKENVDQPEKFVPVKSKIETENVEEVSTQNKIDWGSISGENPKRKDLSGFEEVRKKITEEKEEPIHLNDFEESFEEADDSASKDKADFKPVKKIKKPFQLRKLVLTSILLFVVIVTLSVFMFFNKENNSEVAKFVDEQKPIDTVITKLEELSYDSLTGIEPVVETNDVQKVEIYNKPQNEQKVAQNENEQKLLPKAPPKLPDPIEAPLEMVQEAVNVENSKVEEQISAPPPKVVEEKIEEPTFFVAVEEMPQPVGGLKAIQEKIKYPEIAKRAGVEGKVFVRAFVDENGNVVNAEIVKGIGAGCDEAALDAIQKTQFTPGKQRGRAVKVQVTVPVHFQL